MEVISRYLKKSNKITPNIIKLEAMKELDNIEKEIKMQLYDELDVINQNKEFILLKYTRKLCFLPESLFEVEVSYSVKLFYNEKMRDEIEEGKFNILEEIVRDEQVLFKVISIASQQISQLTGSCGATPIITPTMFIKRES